MIICEIGINHMGKTTYANEYIKSIINAKADGVLFHILEREFYDNKNNARFKLPDQYYRILAKKLKKSNLKFGVSIANPEKIDFFEEIGVDFYKIFSTDILFHKLINKIKNTNKLTFVSTGMSNLNEINKLIKLITNKKRNFVIIHTQLDNRLEAVNLKVIQRMREKYQCQLVMVIMQKIQMLYYFLLLMSHRIYFFM